jgi:uncharacterized tellurite resistance protein B-like protein
MVIHSSFSDFLLFLYIHAAHIDNTYDPQEISTIKAKMSVLFPEGIDIERKLYRSIREYNEFDRSRINELWKDTFEHFRHDKDAVTSKLYEDVREIVHADGRIETSEADLLLKLKRIIDQHAS